MLLGVAYHVSLSFSLGPGWVVQDVNQSKALYVFQAFVHGFRMPLFMLLSGFFTAMLWRRAGLKSLLRNRFKRVLLPCLAGLITVVPATKWAAGFAGKVQCATAASGATDAGIWSAIKDCNQHAVGEWLKTPSVTTDLHPVFKLPALSRASLTASSDVAGLLLEKGTGVHWRSAEGHSALHAAAFLGRYEVAGLLLAGGAGERAMDSASTGCSSVESIAGLLGIDVDKGQVLEGGRRIKHRLEALGADATNAPAAQNKPSFARAFARLTKAPVFILVWFLWFLVWLLPLFSIYAAAAERFGWRMRPHPLIGSQLSLLWLVPLTVVPAWFMGSGQGEFGPDTSMGVIPVPHVLGYYALFFGFGVLYFECAGVDGKIASAWRWTLPVSLFVVFPLALEFAAGTFGLRDRLLPPGWHRAASMVFQTLYAWMMSFGWMGMFRSMLPRENKFVRYMSDASYWVYLAHLPLVVLVQAVVCDWTMPAAVKFLLASLFVSAVMLLSYDKLVRYSFIGSFLNGRRFRAGTQAAAADGAAA
jgi:hypothetical protein